MRAYGELDVRRPPKIVLTYKANVKAFLGCRVDTEGRSVASRSAGREQHLTIVAAASNVIICGGIPEAIFDGEVEDVCSFASADLRAYGSDGVGTLVVDLGTARESRRTRRFPVEVPCCVTSSP